MYKRGDSGQVTRALRVLDALRGYKRGRWVSEIAKTLGTSERTVRRDLVDLQDAGLDIEVTKQANRVYASLTAERSYSPVSITKSERFTLLAVRRVFDVFKRTPFLEDVLSVLTKLAQRMNQKDRSELAAFGEQFIYMPDHGTKSYEGKDEIINAIQSGIINRKLVRYRYGDARGGSRTGYLAPFRMAMYRHGLYAIGSRLKAPDDVVAKAPLGVFAIERFSDAEYLKQYTFAIPDDAPLHAILEGAFGPHLVSSREWHPSQHVSRLRDGKVRLEFRAPSLAPIISWILEWGPHARAIAPSALVHHVKSELEQALAQY